MKVLIINCVSDRSELALYAGLKQAGVDLELIVDPRESQVAALEALGIPVYVREFTSRLDFSATRFLRNLIDQKKYDLIHAPTSRGIAAAIRADKKRRCRLITYRGTMGNLSYWSLASRLAHLNKRVDSIVCNCQAVRQDLVKLGVPDKKLTVIYKGHDPAWYTEGVQAVARETLSPNPDDLLLACVANLRSLKGIDILLQALSGLGQAAPWRCLLIGATEGSKMPALAQSLGLGERVQFMGFRQDVPAILASCDLSIMPSVRREGFPRAIVESLSLSVPVICTRLGGMPEIISDHKNGLIVPAGDSGALQQALQYCLDNRSFLKSAGRCGPITIQERFNIKQTINDYLSLYRSLLGM